MMLPCITFPEIDQVPRCYGLAIDAARHRPLIHPADGDDTDSGHNNPESFITSNAHILRPNNLTLLTVDSHVHRLKSAALLHMVGGAVTRRCRVQIKDETQCFAFEPEINL